MDMLKLKNGSEECVPLVNTTVMSVRHLMESNPIAFVELVLLCRDRNHELFGNTAVDLQGLALVGRDGFVHDSIRNIVLSAVEGEGLEMKLISPLAAIAKAEGAVT